MKRILFIFLIAVFAFTSCEKSSNPEDLSSELKMLKELGVDVSGMKFISTSYCSNTTLSPSYRSDAEVLSVVKGSQNIFFVVNHVYTDNGPQNELLTSFSVPYEDKGQTTVSTGYGETKTVYYAGLQCHLAVYDKGNVYLPVMDWYHEPFPENSFYLGGEYAECTKEPRVILYKNNSTKIITVDQLNDDGLLAPEFNGGVLYNGKAYSSNGSNLYTYGSLLNKAFFKSYNQQLFVLEWNPISADLYFAVRFDLGYTKSVEGLLTYQANLYNFATDEVEWYGGNAITTALRDSGITLATNDRLDSVAAVSKQGGIYKYKVSGIQYSGTKLDFTIALNVNNKTVTIEK